MRNSIRVLTMFVLLCAASAVVADDNADEARAHYSQGIELYNEGKYEQAAIAFERAYELRPQYKILWNVGQVENELGHYAAAQRAYSRYLAEGRDEIPEKRRTQAQAEIARLSTLVGRIGIDSDTTGATVFVDGKRQGESPLDEPVLVDLGEHEVLVKVDGEEIHREVVRVAGGKLVVVNVHGQDAKTDSGESTDTPDSQANEARGDRVWTWVALGIGGAAGITGGVLGGVALSKKKAIDADCENKHCPPDRRNDSEKVQSMALTADILYGVAAAGVIAGVVLFFVEPQSEEEGEIAVAPIVAPDGAGVGLSGRF